MAGLTAAGTSGANTTFSGPVVASEGVTGALTGDVVGNLTGHVGGNVTGNLTGTVLTTAQNSITTMTGLTAAGTSGANTTFSGPIVASEGVTGNVTGNLTGTVQTAAQPNITSVGTMLGMTVSGDIMPTVGSTYSLGSSDKPFKTLFLANETIEFYSSDGSLCTFSVDIETVRQTLLLVIQPQGRQRVKVQENK
jgi:hypothetical protein